jgi:hypothetical protein
MTSSTGANGVSLGLEKRAGFLPCLLLILLFGSSAQASDDLQEIKRCRSIIAEAALLVGLRSQGDVTETFARGFLAIAAEQLASPLDNPDLSPGVKDDLKAASSAIEARDADTLNRISNELSARERQK